MEAWTDPVYEPAADALFGPDSVGWRVRTPLRFVSGVRAVLLQLARAEIATAVAASGSFDGDPLRRAAATIGVLATVRYGSARERQQTIVGLNRVHARIEGTLGDGRPFSAADPELRWWVLGTMFDSTRALHHAYVGSLAPADVDDLYAETVLVAHELGIDPSVIPGDVNAFDAYFVRTCASVDVTDDARRIGSKLMSLEGFAVPAAPVVRAVLKAVVGDLMPETIASEYGLRPRAIAAGMTVAARAVTRPVLGLVQDDRGHVPGRPGLRIERAVSARLASAK